VPEEMMAESDRQRDSQSDTAKHAVLVVDDSDDLRELYETLLRYEGYAVKSAPSAEEALKIVHAWRPGLIITDLFMPGMGGLELITHLHSDFAPPIPPIVVFSGVSGAKEEALKRGAVRFETKPVGPEELRRIVADAFAPERAAWVRPPNSVSKRRLATRALGEATLSKFIIETPDFFDKLRLNARILAQFFGQFSVLIFGLREGKLRLGASSNPAWPLDADATSILPLVNDVAESEGKLVITGNVSRFCFQDVLGDLSFLVAVPYLLDRTVVGVLCLVDRKQHDFSTACIGILEYLASRSTALLRGSPEFVDDSGLLERGAFGAVFQASVISAHDARLALGFTMWEITEMPGDRSLVELLMNLPAPRMMIGVLDQHHVAAFAVAESIALVKERLLLTRRLLESRLTVKYTVELTYEDPVPRLELDVFVARCQELLARAYSETHRFLAMDTRRRE
jgi:CheY-like chemotaxis protein